jgi:hypothetical protein
MTSEQHAKRARVIAACISLIVLCSCATAPAPDWSTDNSTRPNLPSETTFNKEAGNGNNLLNGDLLYLTLRLENGEKLLFLIDTGSDSTTLDKSLEAKLGKCLGTSTVNWDYSVGKRTSGVYETPKLYLGDTRLLLDDRVTTDDLSRMFSGQSSIKGILGMDCLRHYCIQLDFSARKMRFLDPDHLQTDGLGKAFPIANFSGEVSTCTNFFGLMNARFSVDTGCTIDGTLKPKLFQQVLQKQTAWVTNLTTTAGGAPVRVAFFEKVMFDSNVHRHVIISECPNENMIGLRFLARYLVTFNFPKQTMYLLSR